MTPRYDLVILKRAKKGFKVVLVDNRHPSGVTGIPVKWFVNVEVAKSELTGASYQILTQ
jgi:hypothetical protein